MNKTVGNDSVQKNYTYQRSEPEGENFDPEFKPELTPQEMLNRAAQKSLSPT